MKVNNITYRSNSFKIKELIINDYKMLHNFTLELSEDITIIAGINGVGKTTILEYIYSKTSNSVFIPVDQTIDNIKMILPKYIEDIVYGEDILASKVYKRVRDFINKIFKDLEMQIEFDSRDGEGNLFFRNKNGKKFLIDELSTGEKNLLSKVIYFYINDIRNKIILIDGPELSLHPSWQNKMLRMYEIFTKEYDCQIIIATHSPYIIESGKNRYLRVLNFDKNNSVEVINDSHNYGITTHNDDCYVSE